MTDKLRMEIKLKRFGKDYLFTRVTETAIVNPTPEDIAYKKKNKTTTTFTRRAIVYPARAYAIHSDMQKFFREGGNITTGIINVELISTTDVQVGDQITTPKGKYDLVAIEDHDEFLIFEGHRAQT